MSFSIVLNSNFFYDAPGTNNNITYAYDFTNMEEGSYEVSFSYRGQQNHLNGNDLALVYVNFGGFKQIYQAGSDVANKSTFFMGFLHNQIMSSGNDCYLYANAFDNAPVVINHKPTSNFITVQLLDNNGQLIVLHDVADPNVADYVLTLNFKKI